MNSPVFMKNESEKLPSIQTASNKHSSIEKTTNSKCIVPVIENQEYLNNESAAKLNNAIPDELILSIRQAEKHKEYIGPVPNRNTIKPSIPSLNKRPDNLWNHEKQREKFKFLLDQPVCTCGAGRDISFIYDCIIHKPANKPQAPSKFDPSAVRLTEKPLEQSCTIPDSLIPDDYKVVKNHGVLPLRVEDNKHTTVAESHLNHLTIFPSMKPTSRVEVLQLKHTMDSLLKRVGADLDVNDQKGPTQIHNLLELIKQEQDIYNIVFHEIIRQVTVECKERGEVLSKLRERYAAILSRVPREVKCLYEEMLAQRALDRKLTEELVQFRNAIKDLTEELALVKENDRKITEQARIYQKDLQKALKEAHTNADLLTEYHQLYELQRHRLERTIEILIDERELWTKAAYNISLKVLNENNLNNFKRLNIAEKSWSKLCQHCAIFLSDNDIKALAEIQSFITAWKENMNDMRTQLNFKEKHMSDLLDKSKNELNNLKNILRKESFDKNGKLLKSPDLTTIELIANQMSFLNDVVVKEIDSSDSMLIFEEILKKAEHELFSFSKKFESISNRHSTSEANRQEELKYDEIVEKMKRLQREYKERAFSDDYSRCFTSLTNSLSTNIQRLNLALSKNPKNVVKITDPEWVTFYQHVEEWYDMVARASQPSTVSFKRSNTSFLKSSVSFIPESIELIDHDDLVNELQKWQSAYSNYIDKQDSLIFEKVKEYHTKMIHWMIQLLLHLASDPVGLSEEAKSAIRASSMTIEELELDAKHLTEDVMAFTSSIIAKCNMILSEEASRIGSHEELLVENETENLKKIQEDSKDWRDFVSIVISEVRKKMRQKLNETVSIDVYEKEEQENLNENDDAEENQSEKEEDDNEDEDEENDQENQKDQEQAEKEHEQIKIEQDTQQELNQETEQLKNQEPENTDKERLANLEHLNDVKEDQNVETIQNENEEIGIPEIPKEVTDKKSVTFEFLKEDSNTDKELLENITLDETNHFSEDELKANVFNSYKTIETLQNNLIITENRAQQAEARVADLEKLLHEALEKLRKFEQ